MRAAECRVCGGPATRYSGGDAVVIMGSRGSGWPITLCDACSMPDDYQVPSTQICECRPTDRRRIADALELIAERLPGIGAR